MLKKRSIRKILISTSVIFTMFLIYLIPRDNKMNPVNVKQQLEYIDKFATTNPVFLLNKYDMLARTKVIVNDNNKTIEKRASELIEILISGGNGESKIPSGFKSVIPSETRIISLKYEKELLKINFSKELMDVTSNMEKKVIEAIVYTLTTIPEIKNVIIYVEGDILSKLPQSGFNLPSTLNRDIGINKEYDITSLKNINKVTVYYINKHNMEYHYVPVTKYVNDEREKIKIIIDDLKSSSLYNSNLMSFLNSNTELLAATLEDNIMKLTFNDYIFSDMEEKKILEEVIYTIGLSVYDNYDVTEVIFKVNDAEICKKVLKSIE